MRMRMCVCVCMFVIMLLNSAVLGVCLFVLMLRSYFGCKFKSEALKQDSKNNPVYQKYWGSCNCEDNRNGMPWTILTN